MSALPMTEGELREIADLVEAANEAPHAEIFEHRLVGRVEIIDPDTGQLFGHLAQCDDWYGFTPNAWALFGPAVGSIPGGQN